MRALGNFGIDLLGDRLSTDPAAVLARVHHAVARRLATAEARSGVQLAALRVAIASSCDVDQLRGWLSGTDLPDFVTVDLDLRWKILIRLSGLGAIERAELQERYAEEATTRARTDLTQCLSTLPDPEAKAFAWEHFAGTVSASNYEVEAAALGMWQRGQEQVTAPYVDRYFAELADTVDVRSGWLLARAADGFYPWTSIDDATVEAAHRVLSDEAL